MRSDVWSCFICMWIKCNICNAFSKLHANLWSGTNVIPSLEDCVQLFCVAAPCFSERTMIFSCVYDNCNTALSCVLCYFGSFIEKLLIKKGWGKTQDRIIVMMKKLGQKYLNFFMATVTVPHVNHILFLQFASASIYFQLLKWNGKFRERTFLSAH